MVIKRKVKLLYDNEKVEKDLIFREVEYEIAKDMIVKNHYSHKWNTAFGKINIGVYEENILYGVASFGNLMIQKSYKNFNKDFDEENMVELNRLWVDDYLGGNVETILLSASWKIIKTNYPKVKAVQSFADGRLGCGTIYKASNFKYYGYTESVFYEDLKTGETHHEVPFTNTKRPDGMIKLNTKYVKNELKPFRVKTYRYIMPLYKDIKIDMEELPYPKYEIGFEYIDEKRIKDGGIYRSFILAFMLNYVEKDDLLDYIKKNLDMKEFEKQLENDSILEVATERGIINKYYEIKKNYKKILSGEIDIRSEKIEQLSLFDF